MTKFFENHEHYEVKRGVTGIVVREYGLTAPREGAIWSGDFPIPERGDKVYVRFNNFHSGIVRGYFVEYDYLGVYVEPDEPPQWWIDQSVKETGCRHRCCMVFGAELKECTDE